MQKTLSALTLCASIAISVTLCSTGVATAQPQCADSESVYQVLQEKYRESRVSIGVTQGGGLLEVFSSADGVAWTIVVTSPEGVSCVVANGEAWRGVQPISTDPAA